MGRGLCHQNSNRMARLQRQIPVTTLSHAVWDGTLFSVETSVKIPTLARA